MPGPATTVLTDNFFACGETPIKLTTADLREIRRQGTVGAKVRITSNIQGTGHVLPTTQGLAFDLPQTTLEFNGVRHSCYGCLLSIPAMHFFDISGFTYTSRNGSELTRVTIPTMRDLSHAELHLQFKGETSATSSSIYTLVFPIQIKGDGIGATFFGSLGQLQRSRPTFGSLLTEDTPLVMYKGTSLEGRLKGPKCSDAVQTVFYLVALKPLVMRQSDLTRFKTQLARSGSPYDPTKLPVDSRTISSLKRPLMSYIERIHVTAPLQTNRQIQNGYVETEQVKCRPLDMTRDISGNMVYVGGPGKYKTLRNELQDAADFSKGLEDPEATTDVSKVETALAIVIGVLSGIVLIAFVLWWVFKKDGGYTKTMAMFAKAHLKSSVKSSSP
jgi:hypothetical protein